MSNSKKDLSQTKMVRLWVRQPHPEKENEWILEDLGWHDINDLNIPNSQKAQINEDLQIDSPI